MLYQARRFMKFRREATTQHGIHSPFVYDLVTRCFYDRSQKPFYKLLKRYRRQLLSDKRTIEVSDFGAGSKVFKGNTRQIAALARHAGASKKRMKLLARLVHFWQPATVLELGTSLGLGTVALASWDATKVTTLEGCPETAQTAYAQLKQANVQNVEVITGRFRESIPSLLPQTYDIVYFDGHHDKEATLDYARFLLPTAHEGTLWIFDDIHWSPEMTAAWEALKDMPEIRVTIDCFWLGFAFFKSDQAEEHFKVKL